jgi:hypothetical protein
MLRNEMVIGERLNVDEAARLRNLSQNGPLSLLPSLFTASPVISQMQYARSPPTLPTSAARNGIGQD